MKSFKHNNIEFTTFRCYNNECKSLQEAFPDELYWFRVYNYSTKKLRWIIGKSLSNIDSVLIPPSEYENMEHDYQLYMRKQKILKIYER